jgi:hypothetical protein
MDIEFIGLTNQRRTVEAQPCCGHRHFVKNVVTLHGADRVPDPRIGPGIWAGDCTNSRRCQCTSLDWKPA